MAMLQGLDNMNKMEKRWGQVDSRRKERMKPEERNNGREREARNLLVDSHKTVSS